MPGAMNSQSLRWGAALGVAALIGLVIWMIATRSDAYPIHKTVQYSFTIKNPTNQVIENARFTTYAPLKQSSTQKLIGIKSNLTHKMIEDELGNQLLEFELKKVPPFGSLIVSVRAELAFAEQARRVFESRSKIKYYLVAEKYVETEDTELRQLADNLSKGSGKVVAKRIHDWVSDNMTELPYVQNDRGALYALHNKLGDCTEYMYLSMALARANDLPARGIGGFVYAQSAILDPRNYHNWSEIYANKVWYTADPMRKVFDQNQSHYIALRVVGNSATNQGGDSPKNSHSLMQASEGLEVTMNRPS